MYFVQLQKLLGAVVGLMKIKMCLPMANTPLHFPYFSVIYFRSSINVIKLINMQMGFTCCLEACLSDNVYYKLQ